MCVWGKHLYRETRDMIPLMRWLLLRQIYILIAYNNDLNGKSIINNWEGFSPHHQNTCIYIYFFWFLKFVGSYTKLCTMTFFPSLWLTSSKWTASFFFCLNIFLSLSSDLPLAIKEFMPGSNNSRNFLGSNLLIKNVCSSCCLFVWFPLEKIASFPF